MASHDMPELINPLHPSIADKVDPVFAEYYTRYQAPQLRADQVPYEVYKKDPQKYTFPTSKVAGPLPEVASNRTYKVPVSGPDGEIEVQVYVPTADAIASGGLQKDDDDKLPALVDFHGGGFVIGNLKSDDALCRRLCEGAGCIVVNVDYRTAPEDPHPTPVMDSWQALKWVFKNADELKIDPSRVAVSGSSAGGCIAAVLSILARDDPALPPLALQLLIVPLVDARFVPLEGGASGPSSPTAYESYSRLEFAPCLPFSRLLWFYNLWLGTDEKREEKALDFRASPILASSHADLAPASIRCAEIDPLVSEGTAYHETLLKAGTKSRLKVYQGQGHPFGHWSGVNPASKEFLEDCVNDLKEAFSK